MSAKVDIRRALKANRVLWCLFYILLIVTLAALLFLYVFLVRDVTFVGNSRFASDELLSLSGIAYKESMLLVDKEAVTENLQSNPYIVVEDVRRRWPGRVEITVRERTACALTNQLGSVVLLDADGMVLHCAADILQEQMCEVVGWEVEFFVPGQIVQTASPSQLAAYTAVAAQLERFGLNYRVQSIDLTDVLHVQLVMRDGMVVKLGDSEDMTMKMTWLSQMLTELPAEGHSGGTLDLSSGTAATYRPDQQ